MNHAGLIDAEFDFAGLHFLHRIRDIGGDRPRLRIRHQPARTQNFTELTHAAHHVRRSDHGIEGCPVLGLDLSDHILTADKVRAGFGGFPQLVAGSNHQHGFRLPQPVRQHDGAAHHLVGVLGIDAEAHVQFDGLVELGKLDFLDQRNGFFKRVRLALHLIERSRILFTSFVAHVFEWSKRSELNQSPNLPR